MWERKRDDLLAKIEHACQESEEEDYQNRIVLDKQTDEKTNKMINMDSCVLLVYAAESKGGQIHVNSDLEGKRVAVSNVTFTKTKEKRTVARWIAALSELISQGYVEKVNSNVFDVTYSGYNFAEQVKDRFKIDITHNFEEYLVD